MKKLFFSILFTTVFIYTTLAQQAWQNYYSSNEIRINYRSVECHDVANGVHKKVVLLQFMNLTARNLSVSFDKQLWYNNGKCTGCTPTPEQHFTVNLSPKQSLEGSCEDKSTKSLYIVESMLNIEGTALTKFELVSLRILTNR
jgi:hypothetical protein